MKLSRRSFLGGAAFQPLRPFRLLPLLAKDKNDPNRFQIGIQEYTFHRWIGSGKLNHLDYPALAKDKLGITHIEYWNRPFKGKHTDKKYVGELVKRTTGEYEKRAHFGCTKNLLVQRMPSACELLIFTKVKVDCAAQLGCDAIRVNCRSGEIVMRILKMRLRARGSL